MSDRAYIVTSNPNARGPRLSDGRVVLCGLATRGEALGLAYGCRGIDVVEHSDLSPADRARIGQDSPDATAPPSR